MNGTRDAPPFPYVHIHLRLVGRLGEVAIEENALLDTGFDGQVILPVAILAQLGDPDSTRHWTLADGSQAVSQRYEGVIELAGLPNTFSVSVDVIGDEVMVGRRLIENYRVILDHGREVIIEP